ncbi:hypothetical protein C8Q76DRAFT_19732 [Earliella scabrosa]|nr:hypothetical protein C8Q76DRAFT_19732 [Earliella scabrosa]
MRRPPSRCSCGVITAHMEGHLAAKGPLLPAFRHLCYSCALCTRAVGPQCGHCSSSGTCHMKKLVPGDRRSVRDRLFYPTLVRAIGRRRKWRCLTFSACFCETVVELTFVCQRTRCLRSDCESDYRIRDPDDVRRLSWVPWRSRVYSA